MNTIGKYGIQMYSLRDITGEDLEGALEKVASIVKYFIDRGGHQLQLNAVNLETMKDAQIHPEDHQRLVVRIWGWSAYFVELDECYQNQVLRRQEYVP